MSRSEQLSFKRTPWAMGAVPPSLTDGLDTASSHDAEASARRALRAQIARLEREISEVVANGFPGIAPAAGPGGRRPRLLSLAELERDRDALVVSLREAQGAASARAERHRAGRELLAAMQLEPARYKFVRLRAVDVGERGCGVWEVRPRLGVIGMLAGWWHVKLSSGCPLAKGRVMARPLAIERVSGGRGVKLRLACAFGEPRVPYAGCPHRAEHVHERASLTLGHGAQGLLLGHRDLRQEPAAARLSPSALTHQEVGHSHAVGLCWAFEDHLCDVQLAIRDPSLQLGSG